MVRRRLEADIREACDGDRNFVQSVGRAFDVLRCFSGVDAVLGNGDIAERAGLAPSTVSRLTYTLAAIGQLSYLPDRKRYRIGPAALAMGSAALRGLDVLSQIRPILEEVAEQVPGSIGLSTRDGFDMVFLECVRAQRTVGLYSVKGTRFSLPLSAAGRAYVAALPDDTGAVLLQTLASTLPTLAKRLRTWLEANRLAFERDGFAVSCRDWNDHISGVAIPLAHRSTGGVVVLGAGVLASLFDEARLRAEVAPLLLAASRRVAALLDCAPGDPATSLPSTNDRSSSPA